MTTTSEKSEHFKCPKCGALSGDDWSQCRNDCPMPMSPHHRKQTEDRYGEEFRQKLDAYLKRT